MKYSTYINTPIAVYERRLILVHVYYMCTSVPVIKNCETSLLTQ